MTRFDDTLRGLTAGERAVIAERITDFIAIGEVPFDGNTAADPDRIRSLVRNANGQVTLGPRLRLGEGPLASEVAARTPDIATMNGAVWFVDGDAVRP